MSGSYAYKGYPQRPFPQNNRETIIDLSVDGSNNFMGDGQSLDDIVLQNEKANRRQSMPVFGGAQMQIGSPDSRRLSMLQFGDGSNMDDFQFDGGMAGMLRSGTFPRTQGEIENERVSNSDLAINTQFSNTNSPYSNMPAYASPMHPSATLDMDMTSPYSNMTMPLDDSLMMGSNDMNMFPNTQFNASMINSPVTQDFTGLPSGAPQNSNPSMPPPDQYRSLSSSVTPDALSKGITQTDSQEQNSLRSTSRPQSEQQSSSNSVPTQMVNSSLKKQEPIAQPTGLDLPLKSFDQMKFPWSVPSGGFPSTKGSKPHMQTQFKNAYSSTGFDMLGVLVRFGYRLGIE
jgi:hypothetical protein